MRFRILISLALIVASLATLAPASAGGTTPTERKWDMFHRVNKARRNQDLAPLRMHDLLSRKALRHSREMRDDGRIYHSSNLYGSLRRYKPRTWGENVGMAGTVRRLHELFMASAPHRANILRAGYRRVGIGIARAGGMLWATLIFYG
jgi:uncharacterized protein YkwD